jgi:hypothetical protein
MGQRVRNEAGDELELVNNQWVPVSKAAAPAAPEESLLSPGSKFDKFGEAMAISAGDQFTTAGRNIRDVYAMLRGDKQARSDIADERGEAEQIRGRLHRDSPVAATIGAMLPQAPLMLLGGGAPAAGMLGAARVAGTAAANSAAQGALMSESGDYLTDAAIGGGLSLGTSAAGQIVSRVQAGRAAMREARGVPKARSVRSMMPSRTFWPARSARACSCCRGRSPTTRHSASWKRAWRPTPSCPSFSMTSSRATKGY